MPANDKDFIERVDGLARMIAEDCDAMVIVIKRRTDEGDLIPIIISDGDPFTVRGLVDFANKRIRESLDSFFEKLEDDVE